MNILLTTTGRAACIASLTCAVGAAPVYAALEEVVVTARKRTETLLDAPIAVTAFTADAIERAGITRPQDFLGLVPNVNFVTSNHAGDFFVNMRGQASVRFAESAVAVVVDGVQLSTGNEFNGDFFDIEQIEVLKGPQNALYGRNATAGAMIINTRKPTREWEGTALATYGNWNTYKLQGGVGGPITDRLSMRVSASLTDTDGPFQNIVTGENVHRWQSQTGRLRLLWEGERTTVNFIVGGSHGEGGAIAFNAQIADTVVGGVYVPGPNTNAVHDIPFVNDMPGRNIQEKWNTSFRIEHEFQNGMTVESISSYSFIVDNYQAKGLPYADFSFPLNNFTDSNGVPWGAIFGDTTQKWRDENRAFIQEFRLNSDQDQRIRWQVGMYIQDATKIRTNINGLYTGAAPPETLVPNDINSTNPTIAYDRSKFGVLNYSPFANVQFDITENLQLDLAVRYETEERDVRTVTLDVPDTVNGAPTYNQCVLRTGRAPEACFDEDTFNQWQPKVTLSYTFDQDMVNGTVYGTYGKGFKSGGFNTVGTRDQLIAGAIAAGADPNLIFTQDSYDKETTDAFEVGVKTVWLDGRLAFNAALFYTEVSDAQQFEFFPAGNIQAVSRIDEQEIKGFELDLALEATDWLQLFVGYGYTDAEITKLEAQPNFVGNRVPYIEKDNLATGAQVFYPITGTVNMLARLEYKRFGSVWYDSSNLPGSRRDPIELVDARLGITNDIWEVAFWGRNLNNEKYASESVPLLSFLNVPHKAATRSFGIDLRYNF